MTGFLNSIKADLLDRRLLPLVAFVLVALVAAIGYTAFGGGSSTPAPPAAVAVTAPSVASSGLTISQTSPEKAVAEVTSGVSTQHHGASRNPFTPLPEAKAKTAVAAGTSTTASSSTTSSSSSTSGSGASSSGGSTSTTPSTPSTPATPSKPKTVYHVAVLFGQLPVSATSQLTPYENLKLLTPIPSSTQALVVFRGVTAGGKSATFTLIGEAILHGEGACLPSATQCEAIDLRSGQTEQFEYLSASGRVVSYELKVVSITSEKASVAAFKDALHGSSKAGHELLSHNGLETIPYLHYSATAGVLVFAGHRAFAAHAHSARHRHNSR